MGNVPAGCRKTPSASGARNQGAKTPADVTANGLIRAISAPAVQCSLWPPASRPPRIGSATFAPGGLRGPLKSSSVPGDVRAQSHAETGPHRGRL